MIEMLSVKGCLQSGNDLHLERVNTMTSVFLGNLILPDRIVYGGRITCRDGIIEKIEENAVGKNFALPYILPGLVDIHNHGGMGCDYMDATDASFDTIAAYLTQHGITSAQCATVSAPVEQILG